MQSAYREQNFSFLAFVHVHLSNLSNFYISIKFPLLFRNLTNHNSLFFRNIFFKTKMFFRIYDITSRFMKHTHNTLFQIYHFDIKYNLKNNLYFN